MLVSVIDVILITAIATLGAFLYNMAAALLGGIEVTLAEDDAEPRPRFGGRSAAAVTFRSGSLPSRSAARVSRRSSGPIAQTVRALP